MKFVDIIHAETSRFVCLSSADPPPPLLTSWSAPQPFSTCPFSPLPCLFVYFVPYHFIAFLPTFSLKGLLFSYFLLSFLPVLHLRHLDGNCMVEIPDMDDSPHYCFLRVPFLYPFSSVVHHVLILLSFILPLAMPYAFFFLCEPG